MGISEPWDWNDYAALILVIVLTIIFAGVVYSINHENKECTKVATDFCKMKGWEGVEIDNYNTFQCLDDRKVVGEFYFKEGDC